MDIEHLCWLREIVVTDAKGLDTVGLEFSYDTGRAQTPRFFRVPAVDVTQARSLYQEWGGTRPDGYRRGSTVKGPSRPFAPSIQVWRENG